MKAGPHLDPRLMILIPLLAAVSSHGFSLGVDERTSRWLNLLPPYVLTSHDQGTAASPSGLLTLGVPTALASGDLDRDGVEDLLVGYASQEGHYVVVHF